MAPKSSKNNKKEEYSLEEKLQNYSEKTLKRELKKLKAFEIQKLVQKIKKCDTNNDDDVTMMMKDKLEKEMNLFKAVDLDYLVSVCIEQKLSLSISNNKVGAVDDDEATQEIIITSAHKRLMNHKKMKDIYDSLNERIKNGGNKKPKKRKSSTNEDNITKRQRIESKVKEYGDNSGVFLPSLNVAQDGNNTNTHMAAEWESEDTKKKNRPGQRARKAKAVAVQAHKEGRTYESLNWRPKKNHDDEEKEEGKNKAREEVSVAKDKSAAEISNMGKDWKDDDKVHPSWAASKKQTGIAEFSGKKITFD